MKICVKEALYESTDLIDISSIPLTPRGITELAAGTDGRFADFAMGNGHMILLHPEEQQGYTLKSGDIVTVTLDANDACMLEFGWFQNGVLAGAETAAAQNNRFSITIEEDGLYCFSLM